MDHAQPCSNSMQPCTHAWMPSHMLSSPTTTSHCPPSIAQGAGGRYEALIDVPSRVFDVDFVRALRELGATTSLRYIVITRLTPERLPVLARVLAACEQQGLQVGGWWLQSAAASSSRCCAFGKHERPHIPNRPTPLDTCRSCCCPIRRCAC